VVAPGRAGRVVTIEPPLLRFVSLQRLPIRDALSGAASLRTIPLRRCSLRLNPRVRVPLSRCVALAVFRCANGMRKCLTCGRKADRDCTGVGPMLCSSHPRRRRSSAQATTGVPGALALARRSAHQALPQHHSRSGPRSFTVAFDRAAFRYRRHEPSRPGRRRKSFPLCTSTGGAHGVHALRRFAPACGWSSISGRPGPRAISSMPSDPIDFRRADLSRPLWMHECKLGRRDRRSRWMWLLGFDSRLRSVSQNARRLRLASRSFLPWALPFAGFRARLAVHPRGLDPERITKLPGTRSHQGDAPSRHRSWVWIGL